MKILILSALFPPDVSPTASYVKNLATQLQTENTVSILAFGYLPEKIAGVEITCIDKRQSLSTRLNAFRKVLREELPKYDAVLVNNGPSVELPLLLSNTSVPIVYIISDHAASMTDSTLLKYIGSRIKRKAAKVVELPTEEVYLSPERLPFTDDTQATSAYKMWWRKHLKEIHV